MSALDHQTPIAPAATDAPPARNLGPDGAHGVVAARRSRPRDLDALRALARRSGVVCDELELARLLRSDPTERLILCATRRGENGDGGEGSEIVVGLGVIELGTIATMPSLILVEPEYGRPLARWLAETLVEQARSVA